MSIQYVLLDHGSFVYARAFGTVSAQDLVEHERTLLQDPNLTHGYRQLLDCRWVSDDQIDESVLTQLADIHSHQRRMVATSRYAVVAHSAQWFRIGAKYRCEQYGITMIIFNDLSTACIWLGMDYQYLADYLWPKTPTFAPSSAWPVAVPCT